MENLSKQYEERYLDEAEFFDQEVERLLKDDRHLRFTNDLTYEQYFGHLRKYRIVRDFFGPIEGKKILDYACGSGWVTIYFARSGAECHGFDISPKSIEAATRMAEVNAVGSCCKFIVSSAEKLDYPAETFDFVFGNAALHHTDLDKSPAEIARVLKKGGKAAFIDDLRYHPVMWIYRKLTDHKHTKFEKPMIYSNIEKFKPHFSSVSFESLDFLNLLPRKRALSSVMQPIDDAILKALPFTKHFYRHLIIKLIK